MLKRFGMGLGLVALLLLAWLLVQKVFSDQPEENRQAAPQDGGPPVNGTLSAPGEPLDLALKTINLSQGEGGFELWQLKAEWANMQREGDSILVEKPRLTYFSRTEGQDPMYVSSETGSIQQKSQILRFITNVRIIQEDKVMDGDLLVYNGTSKTMTFPQGGVFKSANLSGNASHVNWDINNNTIQATGGVSVLLQSRADFITPAGKTDNASETGQGAGPEQGGRSSNSSTARPGR